MPPKPSYTELQQRVRELKRIAAQCTRAEREAQLERDKLQAVIDNLSMGIGIADPQGKILSLNPEALRIHGAKSSDEVFSRLEDDVDAYRLCYPNGQPMPSDQRPICRAKRDDYVQNYDAILTQADNTARHLSYTTFPISDSRGNVFFRVYTMMDLTERKQIEKALKQSEERLQEAQKMAKIGHWSWNVRTNEVIWSETMFEIFDLPRQPVSFERVKATVYPEDLERWLETVQTAARTKSPFNLEYRIVGRSKQIIWIHNKTKVLKEGIDHIFHGTAQDVSDRKQAQASLNAIEWLLKKTTPHLDYCPQPYGDLTKLNRERLILDSIGREVIGDIVAGFLELLETSAAVYERNGDYAHGIFSSGWCRLLDRASRRLCATDDNALAMAGGKWLCHESCWTEVSRRCIQSGRPVDKRCHGGIRLYAVPIMANGAAVGAVNFGYGDPPKNRSILAKIAEKYRINLADLVTAAGRYESRPRFLIEIAKKRLQSSAILLGALVESKMAQSALEQEKEKLTVTLQSIGDGVITTDIDSRVVLLNKVAENLTGWPQNEAAGRKLDQVFNIINARTRQRCDNPVEKILKTNGRIALAENTALIARDGTQRIIADSGAPIIDRHGGCVGVVLVFRDISEKIELETQLRHAQKMEAVGNLAGGIAHEFNNLLSIIIGNTELAEDELDPWHPAGESLAEIKQAGLRAKAVVKELLSFGRKIPLKRELIDLEALVKASLKLLRVSIPTSIDFRLSIEQEIAGVFADPTRIHQVLINLCNNAAHAMSAKGGSLTIELKNVVITKDSAQKPPNLKPGAYVRCSVSDTGHGIPPQMLDRIFDPYVTTKDVGTGTGLGLAVVHGIVTAHGGAIEVDSQIGKGSTLHIYLPVCNDPHQKHPLQERKPPTGTERILFVDDDASIVKLSGRLLRQLGYEVTSGTDPLRILERFRSNPAGYDLVISDMTMPGLTGEHLAQEILNIRPDMPILICTGYSEKISAEKAAAMGVKGLLMKPVEKADLADTIRKLLDATGA